MELSATLDGLLSAEERERIEAHLAGCAACGALREAIALLARPPEAPPERVWTRIQATLRERDARPLRRLLPPVAAAAAGAMLVLGISFAAFRRPPSVEERQLTETLTAAASIEAADPRHVKIDPAVEDFVLAGLLERSE